MNVASRARTAAAGPSAKRCSRRPSSRRRARTRKSPSPTSAETLLPSHSGPNACCIARQVAPAAQRSDSSGPFAYCTSPALASAASAYPCARLRCSCSQKTHVSYLFTKPQRGLRDRLPSSHHQPPQAPAASIHGGRSPLQTAVLPFPLSCAGPSTGFPPSSAPQWISTHRLLLLPPPGAALMPPAQAPPQSRLLHHSHHLMAAASRAEAPLNIIQCFFPPPRRGTARSPPARTSVRSSPAPTTAHGLLPASSASAGADQRCSVRQRGAKDDQTTISNTKHMDFLTPFFNN